MTQLFRVAALIQILALFVTGCRLGEKGVFSIVNHTGHEFYYVYAVTAGDSFPHWSMTIREDTLILAVLKNGEAATIALPSTYNSTDKVTLQMYTLDTASSHPMYRFRQIQATGVRFLENNLWQPLVIDSLTVPAEEAMKMEDLNKLSKESGKRP